MSAERHVCEPERWPVGDDDRWTCPECGGEYRARLVAAMPLGLLREHILRSVQMDTLGWVPEVRP